MAAPKTPHQTKHLNHQHTANHHPHTNIHHHRQSHEQHTHRQHTHTVCLSPDKTMSSARHSEQSDTHITIDWAKHIMRDVHKTVFRPDKGTSSVTATERRNPKTAQLPRPVPVGRSDGHLSRITVSGERSKCQIEAMDYCAHHS